jgi:RNA polymerase sigma factor (sigma-70 family)
MSCGGRTGNRAASFPSRGSIFLSLILTLYSFFGAPAMLDEHFNEVLMNHDPDALEQMLEEEARNNIQTWMNTLSATNQAIIYKRYFLDIPYDEIEKEMRISSGALRVRVHRSLKTLETFLESTGFSH